MQARAEDTCGAYSLDACINNLKGFCETAASSGTKRFPIIMPPKPLDALVGADSLNLHGCKFDIIDVDPYGSPQDFIPSVLPLLEDESFLFVTTGEMYNVRYHPHETLSKYNIQADDSLKPTRSFFKKDNALILGSWVIQIALKSGIALFPIFIYDYWTGYSGVQRMGFQVKPRANAKAQAIALQQLGNDLFLGIKIMKCDYKRSNDLAWRFSEYDDKSFREFIKSRIMVLEKQLKR